MAQYGQRGGYGGGRGGYGGPQNYGGNGDYGGYNNQFGGGYGEMPSPLDAEVQCVLREIHAEISQFETSGDFGNQFRNARRLLATEMDKLENSIDPEWIEVDIQRPIKVTKKVLIPTYRHPNFNFIGKVLGPKGATLQGLCKTHKCHIYVLGRGSTKDRAKEAELLASGDPQYAHYGGPLHVKVETVAPSSVAYSRVAAVIDELSRILQPIHEDTTPKTGDSNGNDKSDAPKGGSSNRGGGSSRVGGGPMRGGMGGGPPRGMGGMRGRGGNPMMRGGGGRGGAPRGGGGFRPY